MVGETERYCVILTTCGSSDEAEELAGTLVNQRLAACVQITSVTSFYRWEDDVARDHEYLLLIKAMMSRYDDIEQFIRKNHAYDIPEIIRLPVSGGLQDYLHWIDDVTR